MLSEWEKEQFQNALVRVNPTVFKRPSHRKPAPGTWEHGMRKAFKGIVTAKERRVTFELAYSRVQDGLTHLDRKNTARRRAGMGHTVRYYRHPQERRRAREAARA